MRRRARSRSLPRPARHASTARSFRDTTGGGSSMMMCVLVPPMPKELTPARRGPSPGHLVSLVGTKNGELAKSIFGLGVSKVQIWRYFTGLDRQRGLDQTGDAGHRIEMADVRLERAQCAKLLGIGGRSKDLLQRLDFDRIAERGPGAVRFNEADRIPAKRLRPPWLRRQPPTAQSTLGAVKPTFMDPSLLTAEPRMTAWILSPSAMASSIRLSTTIATPSAKTVPLASASNGRVCPSFDRMPPSVK